MQHATTQPARGNSRAARGTEEEEEEEEGPWDAHGTAAHATARSEVVHHTTTTVTTTHHLITSHHVLVESEEGREEVRWHRGSGAGPSDGLGVGTLGAATEPNVPRILCMF